MFREPLPTGCPPDEADEVTESLVVYRLLKSSTPLNEDFDSQRAERPNIRFNTDECHARGLSVFTRRQDLERILKMPRHRGKRVGRVLLGMGPGYIQKTGRGSHHTWWPFSEYDILRNCAVV